VKIHKQIRHHLCGNLLTLHQERFGYELVVGVGDKIESKLWLKLEKILSRQLIGKVNHAITRRTA